MCTHSNCPMKKPVHRERAPQKTAGSLAGVGDFQGEAHGGNEVRVLERAQQPVGALQVEHPLAVQERGRQHRHRSLAGEREWLFWTVGGGL